MATRYAVANDDWSAAATWNGGTLPTSLDDVYCNGFTVTLDQDVTAVSIRNDSLASPVIAAGGRVNITTIASTRTVTANFICNSTTSLLNLFATSGTLNLVGNGTRGNTGNGGNVLTMSGSNGSTVNLTGNWQSGTGGGNSNAIGVSSSGSNLSHTGTITGTAVSFGINFNVVGAKTLSFGTAGPNGIYIVGGTGAGHTVTVANIDNTIAGYTTAQCCVTIAGGVFSAVTINTAGDIPTGTCVAVNFAQAATSGPAVLNVNGGNGDIYWPSTATQMVLVSSGAGAGTSTTVNCRDIYGHRVGVPNNVGVIQMQSSQACTLTVNARDALAGTVSGGNGSAVVMNLSAAATLNLNLSGTNGAVGSTGNVSGYYGASNWSTGTFNLNGIARGGVSTNSSQTCCGFVNNSTGTAFVTKAVSNDYPNGGNTGPQFGTMQTALGGFITIDSSDDGSGGWPACSGRTFVRAGSNGQIKMRESNAGVLKTFGANPTDYPAPANVRDGTAYNSGAQTGTLKVPPAGSVALGVPVDATTGTAVLTLAAIEASTVLAKKAHVDAVPTAVRTELAPELGRMDAAVSTRATQASVTAIPTTPLLAASYVAPDNAGIAAIKAKTDQLAFTGALVQSIATTVSDKTGYSLTGGERDAISTAVQAGILNEGDGQQILNAIVGAIGNTNVDQVALVAAIRSDLERVGGTLATRASQTSVSAIPTNPVLATDARLAYLDAAVSTRFPTSSYVAPLDGAATQAAAQAALIAFDPATVADLLGAVTALQADNAATQAAIAALPAPDNAGIAAIKGNSALIPTLL